jgi:hypothetical protein
MPTPASAPAPVAATLPLFASASPPDKVSGLVHAATLLAQLLWSGPARSTAARPAPRWGRPLGGRPTKP